MAADGTLLAAGRAPGVRTFPTPEVLAAIGAVIGAAAQEAGLPPGWPVAECTVACMANADLPEEEERLAAMITAAGWSTTTVVANDTFAVLRAGLDTPRGLPWGVAVTCGAGINCQGVAPDGRTSGFLALGGITGDWGGAYGLGRAALWWAIRAEDGRGPQTALREVVASYFGRPDGPRRRGGDPPGQDRRGRPAGPGPAAAGHRPRRGPGGQRPGQPAGRARSSRWRPR